MYKRHWLCENRQSNSIWERIEWVCNTESQNGNHYMDLMSVDSTNIVVAIFSSSPLLRRRRHFSLSVLRCFCFSLLFRSYDGNGDDRTEKTAAKQPIRWWYVLSYLYIGETERTLANERTNVTQSLSQCVEKCVKKQRISFVCVCSSQLVAQTTPEQNDLKIFESFTERFYSHIFGVLQQLERGTHKFSIEGELTRYLVIALLCFDCNVSTCAILYRNRVFHVSPAKWRRFRVYILLL